MSKLYSVDQKRDYRKVRPEIVLLAVVLLLIAGAGFFIALDINRNPTVINETKNQPVLGQVESVSADYKLIETDDFDVEIPTNWTEVNPPQVIVNGARYYPQRFQGTTGDNIGRSLEIYVDDYPAELPITKIASVTTSETGINPIEISPQCTSFTDFEDVPSGVPVPGKWNNIEFTCKNSTIANNVIALENDQDDALSFTVSAQEKKYLIVYTDHGSDLDNTIFFTILKSFKAK